MRVLRIVLALKLLTPVLFKGIKQVVCREHGRKVIDLNHMAKVIRVDPHVLKTGVVTVDMLNGNSHCLFQVCHDLILQKHNTSGQDLYLQSTANMEEVNTVCM